MTSRLASDLPDRWETEAIRQAHYKIDDVLVAEQMMAVMLEQPR